MRHTKTYDRNVKRALNAAKGDLVHTFETASDLGIKPDAFEQLLLADLENDGPIFGKFLSNLMGGAEASVIEAKRQGIFVGEIASDQELAEAVRLGDLSDDEWRDLFDDPEAIEEIEDRAGDIEYMWIAMLVNSCDICTTLHGSILTRREWADRGLAPETVHVQAGYNSPCYCDLIPQDHAKDRADLVAPLKREVLQSKTGLKGNRRTARSIAQENPDKALAAMQKARESVSGRRTLRLLGESNNQQGSKKGSNDE